MGNYLCWTSRKKSNTDDDGDDADSGSNADKKEGRSVKEDVTYATIDHSNAVASGGVRHGDDDDCDYAVVYVPAQEDEADEASAKEDAAEDYVLME